MVIREWVAARDAAGVIIARPASSKLAARMRDCFRLNSSARHRLSDYARRHGEPCRWWRRSTRSSVRHAWSAVGRAQVGSHLFRRGASSHTAGATVRRSRRRFNLCNLPLALVPATPRSAVLSATPPPGRRFFSLVANPVSSIPSSSIPRRAWGENTRGLLKPVILRAAPTAEVTDAEAGRCSCAAGDHRSTI